MIVRLYPSGEEGPDLPPARTLRWDLAWDLFLPDCPGDVPTDRRSRAALSAMTAWAWQRLGQFGGRMQPGGGGTVFFVVPDLSAAAREFVIRVASFWADEVYAGDEAGPENELWTAPVVELASAPAAGSLAERLSEADEGSSARHLFPQLGFGRARMVHEIIEPGHASARLHSHSHVDEYYLVLSGRGTLRMGAHRMPVAQGSLIGKPTGPDLTSHIVADRGERVTVLDIEVWPEAGYRAKDVVHYPDFGELLLRGAGWGLGAPADALGDAGDMGPHYEHGYRRQRDSGWTPLDIPGAPARQTDGGLSG